MSDDYDFGKELVKSLDNCNCDKVDLLKMIFKTYVAKSLELLMEKYGGGVELQYDFISEVRSNLIKEFRAAKLDSTQRSVKIYEDWFDTSLQEILNEAGLNHEGEDSAKFENQVLDINASSYINDGGLYVPSYLSRG